MADEEHIGMTLGYVRERTGTAFRAVSRKAGKAVRGKPYNDSWASGVVGRSNVELSTIVAFARACGCQVQVVITIPGDPPEDVVIDCSNLARQG